MSDSDDDSLFAPHMKYINGSYHVKQNQKQLQKLNRTESGRYLNTNSPVNAAQRNKIAFCGFSGGDGRAPHHMGNYSYSSFSIFPHFFSIFFCVCKILLCPEYCFFFFFSIYSVYAILFHLLIILIFFL